LATKNISIIISWVFRLDFGLCSHPKIVFGEFLNPFPEIILQEIMKCRLPRSSWKKKEKKLGGMISNSTAKNSLIKEWLTI